MRTANLTNRQREILDYIIACQPISPTVREIGEEFGIRSPNGVMCHMKALKKKGCIDWAPHCARTIRVLGMKSIEERVVEVIAGSKCIEGETPYQLHCWIRNLCIAVRDKKVERFDELMEQRQETVA